MGETPLMSFGVGGKVDVLECESRTVTRACRSNMAKSPRFFPQLEIVDLVLPILSVYIAQLIKCLQENFQKLSELQQFLHS